MDEFELHAIATKSVKGVFALVSRSFLLQLLGVATSFILTIFLDPASFGIFFVVSSIIVFFNYFQDIGLAASLIQKKEEPTVSELRTVFFVQQILVLALVIPAVIFSHAIASFYKLNTDGYVLYISLLVSFFLSSLRTIPTVLLERKLDYGKLVIPQILENLAYNICLILFAVMGFKVETFTIAVLARSSIGLIATYIVQPWPIGISFEKHSLKKLISFGIPFQTNSILALFKDDFRTIYLGKVLPIAQLGYIGFAEKLANLPLRLVMDNVIKVTFPSFSRLQEDEDALKLAIEKSLFLISIAIFPIAVGIISYSPFLMQYIPKYQKWEPAMISIMFFSLGTVLSSISTPLTNFLNAIGKVKITLYFMVFWTIAIWVLTLPLINLYGYNGVAAASFLVSLSSIAVFWVAKKYVKFRVFGSIYKQIIAAIVMYAFAFITRDLITSLFGMFVFAAISLCVYVGVIMLIAGKEVMKTSKFVISSIRNKQ
jgi:O-antigen/teichoic acid export membrane protein